MTLSATQEKRLEEIGAYLIEEGFSDILTDANLLPELHILDKIKTSMITSGSNSQRLCNVLKKMGTTGEAFSFFATHRSDLFSQQERVAFATVVHNSRNKAMYFDSHAANKLLAQLDGKTKFEQLPYLVTPFASYYRGANKIAKLYHVHALMQVHTDLHIMREIIATTPLVHTRWLSIICEFADFIVDYFGDNELATIKRTTSGALFSSKNGILITDVKKILKKEHATDVAHAAISHWLKSVFTSRKLLYDLYAWQWTKEISYQDIEPVVTISELEKKILLTLFTALSKNDEQTAAACIINMCEATETSLDLAERLVSGHHAKQRHIFEGGIAILEDALNEGMQIKPTFAKIAASGAQLISIIKQYLPHDKKAFDEINTYLATHDIILQQITSNSQATIEAPMTNKAQQQTHDTNDQTTATTQAIERLAKEIDKSSNRIAYSAIIAAFTIAGALLVSNASQDGIIMLGVPFFVIAFLSSLLLISSIVKEPK